MILVLKKTTLKSKRDSFTHELPAIQPVNQFTPNIEQGNLVEDIEPRQVLWLAAHGDLAAVHPKLAQASL